MKGKLKNIVSIGKRDNIVGGIDKISKQLISAGEYRIQYGESWKEFAKQVAQMGLSQNPQVQEPIDTVKADFEALGDIHITLGQAQIRNGEDTADLQCRYEAMFNRNEEYIKAKYHFKVASDKLAKELENQTKESAKPNYAKKQEKVEAKVNKAKEEKRATLEAYKNSLRVLIDAKDRYNKFKVRRLTEGWTLYGIALKRACTDEEELMHKLQADLQTLKDSAVDPSRVASLEQRLTQNLENAPTE